MSEFFTCFMAESQGFSAEIQPFSAANSVFFHMLYLLKFMRLRFYSARTSHALLPVICFVLKSCAPHLSLLYSHCAVLYNYHPALHCHLCDCRPQILCSTNMHVTVLHVCHRLVPVNRFGHPTVPWYAHIRSSTRTTHSTDFISPSTVMSLHGRSVEHQGYIYYSASIHPFCHYRSHGYSRQVA